MADAKRFTLARKEKQNADIIRKQNLARIFLLSILNEEIEEEDMSIALQDGVLLCRLINAYKPDSIKKFNSAPRTPFKMMENAAFVLDFCKKNAIPVTFTAEHICNRENLILILTFILTIAERMAWSPPDLALSAPLSSPSPSLDSSSSHSPTSSPLPPSPSPPPSSPSPTPISANQKSHAQTNVPTTTANSRPQAPPGSVSVRTIFEDLIASEKEFQQDMDLFFKLYMVPLKGQLPPDKTNGIFGNLENLVQANAKFLQDLSLVFDGFVNFATVWDNFAAAINIYSVYCIFQQHSHAIVEQCRREFPAVDAHLRSVEHTPESKNSNIFNFLVKPFARVVKYNSVLKQLLQIVPAGTEDHQSLTEVKKQFQDLHDTTNETWKKVENSRKLAEIAGKLMGAEKAGLRKPGRVYLREGDFMLNGKPAKLYLFSDIVMYAAPVKAILKKSGGKSHIFKGTIALNACSFQDLPDSKDGKNVMEFTTSAKTYKAQAPSPSDKRLWVADIKKCIAKINGEATGSASPLGPRPQLDLRRGVPGPTRQDSQPAMNYNSNSNNNNYNNQLLVEERRKTVKLAFGSASQGSEDDEEDRSTNLIEEADEVQLEIKPSGGGILTEEDKRKTIKLEFGVPQRQLTIRDRSKTVELGFKPKEAADESNEHSSGLEQQQISGPSPDVELEELEPDHGYELQASTDGSEDIPQEGEVDIEESTEDSSLGTSQETNQYDEQSIDVGQNIDSEQNVDAEQNVDPEHNIDPEHHVDAEHHTDSEYHAGHHIDTDTEYHTGHHVDTEHHIPTEHRISTEQNTDILSSDMRGEHRADSFDHNEGDVTKSDLPEAGELNGSGSVVAEDAAQPHAPVPAQHHASIHQHSADTTIPSPLPPSGHDVSNLEEHLVEATEPVVDKSQNIEGATDLQATIHPTTESHHHDHHDHHDPLHHHHHQEHHDQHDHHDHDHHEPHHHHHHHHHGQKEDHSHSSHDHSLNDGLQSSTIIATLHEEIGLLKEGIKAAHELAQTTAQELEKEREETKVWKARVERILAVLLDTMKQNSASNPQ